MNVTTNWPRMLASLVLGPALQILGFLITVVGAWVAVNFFGLASETATGPDYFSQIFANNIIGLLAFTMALTCLSVLGSYLVGRLARSREIALSIWSALVVTVVFVANSIPQEPILTWIVAFGMMLFPTVPGGYLARRHRLRREARAEQAIIDTF